MSIIDAIVLGLVQGVTEFIPVSSSGHLVIASSLLGVGNSFIFDVLLNIGTLLALIIYYRKRIWSIIVRVFQGREWILIAKLVVATIPAVVIGLLLDNIIEMLNGYILVVVVTLLAIGILMILFGSENKDSDDREIEQSVGWKKTIKLGLAQMIALIPGISRSGITILTGLKSNLSAKRAAEFSFLMAIPVTAGAICKTLIGGGVEFIKTNPLSFVIGNITSFVFGILAISFLIKLISKKGLKPFGYYRIALAIILFALVFVGLI